MRTRADVLRAFLAGEEFTDRAGRPWPRDKGMLDSARRELDTLEIEAMQAKAEAKAIRPVLVEITVKVSGCPVFRVASSRADATAIDDVVGAVLGHLEATTKRREER